MSITNFFSKCDQICGKLRICSHLLRVSIMENFIFCAMYVSIHQRYLRFLVRETFKSVSQTKPEFMWSFFKQKKLTYGLRKGPVLNVPRTHSTYYGTNVVHSQGSFVWNNLPAEIKSSKIKVKKPENIDCGCLVSRSVSFTTVLSLLSVLFYVYFWLEFISFR